MTASFSKITNKIFLATPLALVPFVTFAQQTVTTGCSRKIGNLRELFRFPVCIINSYIIPLLITLAVLGFMFGVVRYIANAGDQAQHTKMRDFILWSLLALFIILSVWAILYFVGNSLQLGQ